MDNRMYHEEADVALKAQAHVWNQMYSFINSASLKCAVELGIPDIIHKHGKPMTLTDLADSLHVPPAKVTHVHRLMRTLINSGFFVEKRKKRGEEEAEEATYVLAPPAHYLLDGNPCSMKPYLLAMISPVPMKPWGQLSSWFKNADRTPFETTFGMTAWEVGGSDPKLNSLFNEAMASDARLVAKVLLDKDKDSGRSSVFEGVKSIVDVGGGYGIMAEAIAAAFPDMKCTNFDLPHVVAGLEGVGNLKHVQGDMFESIPPAHAILLKWVLHDWKDEDCVKILKNCKEAIVKNGCKGGKVIIIDMVVNEQHQLTPKAFETQLLFDMRMMCYVSGKEREEKEFAKLFEDAGFSNYKITPMLGLRSLIEVFP